MKTQCDWQVVPHPITALKPLPGTAYFVGDGKVWGKAFYDHGAWCYGDVTDGRIGSEIQPQPTHFLTPLEGSSRPGEAEARAGWDCGNRGLAARYLMLLVERNPSMTADQLERFSDTINQAGPRWCEERLDRFTNDQVPF